MFVFLLKPMLKVIVLFLTEATCITLIYCLHLIRKKRKRKKKKNKQNVFYFALLLQYTRKMPKRKLNTILFEQNYC